MFEGRRTRLSAGAKYYLAKDPKTDTLKYTPWDRDQKALDAMAALNDATNPDIRPFIERGGKPIVWQGGADAANDRSAMKTAANYVCQDPE